MYNECTDILFQAQWYNDSHYKTQVVNREGNEYQTHCLPIRCFLVSESYRVQNLLVFLAAMKYI